MGLFGPKMENVVVQERTKPDEQVLDFKAKFGVKTKGGETILVTRKKDYIIPVEKKDKYVRLVGKRGRMTKMWLIENGQVVEPPSSMANQANPMLDQQTVTAIQNRASARRLATFSFSPGEKYLMLLLGVVVGIAIGWILYPQFSHAPPIIQTIYCTHLPNGTVVPRTCPA